MKTNTTKIKKDTKYMKKLLFVSIVSAGITATVFAEDASKGVKFSDLKLGDSLYLQETADSLMKPYRTTTNARGDMWYITYNHQQMNEGMSVSNSDVITNKIGQVFANVTTTVNYPTEAVLIEHSEGYINYPITYSCSDPNVTISNNHVYAAVPGLYTIMGTDAKGGVAYIDVPFQKRSSVTTSYSQYIADADTLQAQNRNRLINEFIDICSNSNLNEYVWTREGGQVYTNNEIQAIIAPHAWSSTQPNAAYRGGNVWPWAISPHVMATAWHYSWSHWWSGNATLTNYVSGGTFTVHKSAPWVNARDWAIANGWTEDEANAMNISDIALIVIDVGSIPSECCPYFTDTETIDEVFGTLKGLPCWTRDQSASHYALPGVYGTYGDYGTDWSMGFHYIPSKSEYYRLDLLDLMSSKDWNLWSIVSGDSGRSIFFRWKGQNVITASYYSAGGGPSYVKGFPVIKAFVEAHGDTLKVMQK